MSQKQNTSLKLSKKLQLFLFQIAEILSFAEIVKSTSDPVGGIINKSYVIALTLDSLSSTAASG